MSRRKIDLEYTRPAVGHPAPRTVVRVELTEQVQALLDQGLAVDLGDPDAVVPAELDAQRQSESGAADPSGQDDDRPVDTGDHNGPADPPTNPDETTAPDGSTKLPAKKTPAKKTARARVD